MPESLVKLNAASADNILMTLVHVLPCRLSEQVVCIAWSAVPDIGELFYFAECLWYRTKAREVKQKCGQVGIADTRSAWTCLSSQDDKQRVCDSTLGNVGSLSKESECAKTHKNAKVVVCCTGRERLRVQQCC